MNEYIVRDFHTFKSSERIKITLSKIQIFRTCMRVEMNLNGMQTLSAAAVGQGQDSEKKSFLGRSL